VDESTAIRDQVAWGRSLWGNYYLSDSCPLLESARVAARLREKERERERESVATPRMTSYDDDDGPFPSGTAHRPRTTSGSDRVAVSSVNQRASDGEGVFRTALYSLPPS